MNQSEELIKANKLEDVNNFLNEIINSNYGIFPVRMFINDGKPCSSLRGVDVRQEANSLLNAIRNEFNITEIKNLDIENFFIYISDKLIDFGYNIANHLSHRDLDILYDNSITEFRTIAIISNMLDCAYGIDYDNEDTCHDWNIPENWYRLPDDV